MRNRVETTQLFLVCLLSCVIALAACSSSTNFVVANGSNHPIEVRYRLKKPIDPIAPSRLPEVPSIKLISELGQQISWRELPASRFTFDPDTRTAVVSLMPEEALRVEQSKLIDCQQDDTQQAANFSLEEISITGSNGELRFQGEQVRKRFLPSSKTMCVLTYR